MLKFFFETFEMSPTTSFFSIGVKSITIRKMRVSTLIAATLAASATASEFYWKHDSEW